MYTIQIGAHTGKITPHSELQVAFFDGFIEGYMTADPSLIRVEEIHLVDRRPR